MLSGLAPRTICNCVFMAEKTQAKKQQLESTHRTFSKQRELAHRAREGREGREKQSGR